MLQDHRTGRVVDEADLVYDDGPDPCRSCGEPPALRICDECDRAARVIDCGCRQQPRPWAVDGHRTLCDLCADEKLAAEERDRD